ncbi:TetR/AcrR family transcriptional regulator [Lysinibacillus sp. 54212]|uniref:TetR/AcrR family transcriptional regulator n=1 Tax=Lysinibacillus sp. 54212 TaxID=3119829 RepID=UPI002FC82CDE
MRENFTDLRVVRTIEAIKEALVELIEEKGFESITVKDITSKAKINRGTFYAHYRDKYDLMNRYQDELMGVMTNNVKHNLSKLLTDLSTNSTNKIPIEMTVLICDFLDRNRRFMKAVLGPKGDISFQTKLKNFISKALLENYGSIVAQEKLLVPEEYLITYIASAHIGIIQQWLLEEKKESSQEISEILLTITLNGPFVAAGLKK